MTDRVLNVIVTEPLTGRRVTAVFDSACHDATAKQGLFGRTMRWLIEITNRDAKGSLGFDES